MTANPVFRLVVSGGGTGGHTYPALTAVRALQTRLGGAVEVLWIGSANSLESRVAEAEGIPFAVVATGKIRRDRNPIKMLSGKNMKDMAKVPVGANEARSLVAKFKPDVVLATGGYVAVPVGLAAKMTRRPLVVHEQTVRLGLANRVLSRVAAKIALSSESSVELLPENARAAAVVTGNPVRPAVLSGEPQKAIEALGLQGFDPALPTVYITGGAQGAQQINRLVAEILPWLLTQANVLHQCGPANLDELQARAATLPVELAAQYHVTGYLGSELPDVLALADVVISRSGAGTVAELTALGKASVLIPYAAAAGNEQAHNAQHLADHDAAVALIGDLTAEQLQGAVAPLLSDPSRRRQVADNARAQGRPDAADRLVDVLLEVAKRP
ncbi:glycosyltransferase [Cryptosporangium sp. NPDC048952]|uniref:UDP-N-acetylglucosamine--N-acetylmuramyl- (pentapeptide) pyrophosphoryl-undecaprenol N-acetylglucosamine transferase n=1 Tax=Cryptosporangium sp. NPDC048952 TaxID=3363961 RepID=UPI00372210CD